MALSSEDEGRSGGKSAERGGTPPLAPGGPSCCEPLLLRRRPRPGESFEVAFDSIDHEGHGCGQLHALVGPQREPRRFTVRVRGALPGDRARITVRTARRGSIYGRVAALIDPSPHRIAARCPHFAREGSSQSCGGCTLQSLPYGAQLELKHGLVRQALERAGITQVRVLSALGQDDPWHYRNKMEFSFAERRDKTLGLGLHPAGYRHEVIDLQRCYLVSPFVAPFLDAMRCWAAEIGLRAYRHATDSGWLRTLTIREGKRTGQRLVELTTAASDTADTADGPTPSHVLAAEFAARAQQVSAQLGEELTSVYWTSQRIGAGQRTRFEERCLAGLPTLAETLELPLGRRLTLEIHPRAFFQPNTLQAEVLYGEVLRAAGGAARLAGQRVLDLYCGTGTIALCLACFAERVIGVELVAHAVQDARRNAAANGLHNAAFIAGDAGKVLAGELRDQRGAFDLVVVDPPRAGLSAAAVKQLGRVGAPRLVYVSCNPIALARDLSLLADRGYRASLAQPVDMFPHTAHVETVMALQR